MPITDTENKKLPVSAMVVGLNEGVTLKNCLSNINFCKEILYFDLGSQDGSKLIAESEGATFIKHELVPIVEIVLSEQCKNTSFDWILITDPDETLDIELQDLLIKNFSLIISNPKIGAVSAPWMFYFKGRRLKGTPWGGTNRRILLAHKDKFIFTAEVHNGRKLAPGFEEFCIELEGNNFIHHYWMNSWRQLINKHKRYLTEEGESRYKNGHRTSPIKLFFQPLRAFIYSYFTKQGFRDGLTGLELSIFWSWYQSSALFQLYKYQIRNN